MARAAYRGRNAGTGQATMAPPPPVRPSNVTLEHPVRPHQGVQCKITFTHDGLINWEQFVGQIKLEQVRVNEDSVESRRTRNHTQKSRRRLARAAEDWMVADGANIGLKITDVLPTPAGAHRLAFHPILLRYLLQPSVRGGSGMEPADADPSVNAHARDAIADMCAFCAHKASRVPVPGATGIACAHGCDAQQSPMAESTADSRAGEQPPEAGGRVVMSAADRALLDDAEGTDGRVDVMSLVLRDEAGLSMEATMRVLESGIGESDDASVVRAAFRRCDDGQCDIRSVPRALADMFVAYARDGRVEFEAQAPPTGSVGGSSDDSLGDSSGDSVGDWSDADSRSRACGGRIRETKETKGRLARDRDELCDLADRMRALEGRMADILDALAQLCTPSSRI